MRNPAYGVWTEEETNWSQRDSDMISEILKEDTVETSFEKILDAYEESIPLDN